MASKRQVAAQAEAQALARKKRIRKATAITAIGVLFLVGIIALGVTTKSKKASIASSTPATAAVIQSISQIPEAVNELVGAGKVSKDLIPITAPALTVGGKPRILYIGAEYCPLCAAERWPLVVALSRFGTFSGLGQTSSSSVDVFPNTKTLSFHGASYASKYVSFTGVETKSNQPQGNSYATLDTPTSADQKLLSTYDAAPYLASSAAGSIPFIDFGGKYLISGATYDPGLLANRTSENIARTLSTPSDPLAQAVLGSANRITAAICQMTGQLPASVCKADPIPAITLPTANS